MKTSLSIQIAAGYDLDGVLANFQQAIIDYACQTNRGQHFPDKWESVERWFLSPMFSVLWREVRLDPDFWLSIKSIPHSMPDIFNCGGALKPRCYITARPISSEVSAHWLALNNYPEAPVITVRNPLEKLEACRAAGVRMFVDDYVPTVRHLRAGGVNAFLFDSPHQREHSPADLFDLPRITSLREMSASIAAKCRK